MASRTLTVPLKIEGDDDNTAVFKEVEMSHQLALVYQESQLALDSVQAVFRLSWQRRYIQLITAYAPPMLLGGDAYRLEVGTSWDLEWEKMERPFHEIAINRLNQRINLFGSMAPDGVRFCTVSLEDQLRIMMKSSREQHPGLGTLLFPDDQGRYSGAGDVATEPLPVHVPLLELDACAVCENRSSLRLCASCGEAVYCSRDCQRYDWAEHKSYCGKTEKINLRTFYPFIANMIDSLLGAPERDLHPATISTIEGALDLGDSTTSVLPDGSRARVVQLGAPCLEKGSERMEAWWPMAPSLRVATMFHCRIEREGWLVPVLTAACFSLLSIVYTTTWIPPSNSPNQREYERLRFHYRGYPISDFGIAKGKLDATPRSVRVYLDKSGEQVPRIQDPDDHYWIYFTTLGNEEILLDCGLYSYDHGSQIISSPYRVANVLEFYPMVPARLEDKASGKYQFKIHHEKKRFSVLRDTDLHGAIKGGTEDPRILWQFMDKVAERDCSETEKYLARIWTHRACLGLMAVCGNKDWSNWPSEPIYIVEDPITGEVISPEPIEDKKWVKEMKKLSRRFRDGEITQDVLASKIKDITEKARQRQRQQQSS